MFAVLRKITLVLVPGLLLFTVPVSVAGAVVEERIGTRDGAEMVLIPGGTFLMGSPQGEGLPEEFPQHEVDLAPFYMDTTEVTNGRYADFLNEIRAPEGKEGQIWNWVVLRSDLEYPERVQWWPTEISFKQGKYQATPGRETHPLITISWHGAEAYCKYFGKRLPTEAEWEKAARGGLEGKRFPWGDAFPTGGATYDRRWMTNEEPAPTTPVGSYAPNGYGLYDMSGNVWEWCSDGFDPEYYKKSPAKDPKGANDLHRKVLRGGSWFNPVQFIRVAQRNFGQAELTQDAIGFRCVMDPIPEAMEKAGARPVEAGAPEGTAPTPQVPALPEPSPASPEPGSATAEPDR